MEKRAAARQFAVFQAKTAVPVMKSLFNSMQSGVGVNPLLTAAIRMTSS
jgi:hypothetical protein